jgi:putative ABC transport system ATP-binding protein
VTPVLALTGVRKAFGDQPVLRGVDLTVERGEVVAVAGRSGSGKTTLLGIITGWSAPDEGSVDTHPGERWHELAVLPQSLGLLDELTIAENVALPLRLAPDVDGDEPGALLAALGLTHLADRHPDEVSLGEQQRAGLARAAVARPSLLVADEPISHQNREWGEAMMRLLTGLAAGGTACLLATHDELAFGHANRVLALDSGRLEARTAGK